MDQILALRPFVPARDFALSRRFYQALGFSLTHEDATVAILKCGGFSFLLQNFYVKAHAENCAVQILMRDVDAWWAATDPAKVAAEFGLAWPPRPPAMQSWGLKVGVIADPSGVLWHIAEAPF